MKGRVKCPICHRTVSQHCLLYTHVCPKSALDKKPKTPTVEEKFEEHSREQPPPETVAHAEPETTQPEPPVTIPKPNKYAWPSPRCETSHRLRSRDMKKTSRLRHW